MGLINFDVIALGYEYVKFTIYIHSIQFGNQHDLYCSQII